MPRASDKPRASELPGLVVATMMLQRVRLMFTKRSKPPDDRRWAVSCETLWKHSVYINDATVVAILDAVHAHAHSVSMKNPRASFTRRYHVQHQLAAVVGDERALPGILWDEVIAPWMHGKGVEAWG